MDRAGFLKSGAALSVAAGLPRLALASPEGVVFDPMPGAWRTFDITTRIEILKPVGTSRAWVPLAAFEQPDWIRPISNTWTSNAPKAVERRVTPYGARLVYAEWTDARTNPVLEVASRIMTRDRAVDFSKPGNPKALSSAERRLFTAPTALIPTDGIVKQTSDKITAGADTDLEKTRRIYEWIVDNTFRNPTTRGCGLGNITVMLTTGDMGGKCADLNDLFVGLARAAGIPARDLYGIRVAPSKFGFKALGANSETITKAQHCRSEVYLDGFGWVPMDPADVRKVVLEEPPGNLAIGDAKVAAARKTLFGAWETNWIAYNEAHDVPLPGSDEPPVGFLMYPQGETGTARIDCLSPDDFKYTISSKEIVAT